MLPTFSSECKAAATVWGPGTGRGTQTGRKIKVQTARVSVEDKDDIGNDKKWVPVMWRQLNRKWEQGKRIERWVERYRQRGKGSELGKKGARKCKEFLHPQ